MLLKNYCHNCFKSGQETLDEKPRSRKTSTSFSAETISKFKELADASQQITISELVNETGISCGSAQTNLTDLQMRWDHNNAASHTVMAVKQFLAAKQMALWQQPLYSNSHCIPTPCDFWLFPTINMGL